MKTCQQSNFHAFFPLSTILSPFLSLLFIINLQKKHDVFQDEYSKLSMKRLVLLNDLVWIFGQSLSQTTSTFFFSIFRSLEQPDFKYNRELRVEKLRQIKCN